VSLFASSPRIGRFSLEPFRLYILYMGVGLSAIPAGVAYGVLSLNGFDRWWAVLLPVALGLGMGRLTWRYVDSMLLRPTKMASAYEMQVSAMMLSKNAVAVLFISDLNMVETMIARTDVESKVGGDSQVADQLEEMYACAHN
jgi:hypothetical protein